MNKKLYPLLAILAVLTLLSACGGKADNVPTATPEPVVNLITAEGHIVPNKSLYLAFSASGRVSEILVAKGERVAEGQVLARIGDTQQAESALAAAKLAETAAQQDLDALLRTADVAHAQAWTTFIEAQKNRAAAQLAWDRLDQNAMRTDIEDAQADVTARKADLKTAQEDFDKYSDLPADNDTRKTYEDDLRTAQVDYDLAVQKMEALTAQRDRVRAALDLALAAEAETKRAYENTKDGADVDKLALAEARLESARAQAAAAQSALDNFTLKAPFAGIVEEVNISVDQVTGPTTWAIALADTSAWYVDTSDLGELDVVNIDLDQSVTIAVDALPGETFTGVVESISGAPTVQGGDILYKAHIRLDAPDKAMRWGMTVEVTFEGEK